MMSDEGFVEGDAHQGDEADQDDHHPQVKFMKELDGKEGRYSTVKVLTTCFWFHSV